MLESNELKVQALRYFRSLQAALKAVITFSVDHRSTQLPIQQSHVLLTALLKETGQVTLGFVNNQVMVDRLLTANTGLAALENEFLKRGVGAITFSPGVTLGNYRRLLTLLSTPVKDIENAGGIRVLLAEAPMDGVRILPAPKNERRSETGDTILDIDAEAYLRTRDFQRPTDVLDSFETFLEAAGLDKATRSQLLSLYGGVHRDARWAQGADDQHERARSESTDANTAGTATAAVGAGLSGGASTGQDGGFLGLFEQCVTRALTSEGNVEKSYVALAQLLQETGVEYVLTRFSEEDRNALRHATPEVVAGEFVTQTAFDWAHDRLNQSQTPGDKVVVEEEVVHVLARALRATQSADRLAQKLAKFVQEYAVPKPIVDRIQEELRWSSLPIEHRHARLLRISHFDAAQFRRLIEQLQFLLQARREPQAVELAIHYVGTFHAPAEEILPEHASRLPELIRLMAPARGKFVPLALDHLKRLLLRTDFSQFIHFQIASALSALAQSVAVFEDFATVSEVGAVLQHVYDGNPEAHEACCGLSQSKLLTESNIERVLEIFLVRKEEPEFMRVAARLLRWSRDPGVEKLFTFLEQETSGKNRIALVRLLTYVGQAAIAAAVRRLQDSRWYVVRNACLVLGEINDPELETHIAPALSNPEYRVQHTAAQVLMKNRSPRRAAVLAGALRSLHPSVLDTVLDELLYLKDETSVSGLKRYVAEPNQSAALRKKAMQVIAAIPGHLAGLALDDLASNTFLPNDLRSYASTLLAARARSAHA